MTMKELTADEMELVAGGWFLASQPPEGGGGGRTGAFMVRIGQTAETSVNWARVAQGLHSNTVTIGMRDISYFRTVGGHIPHSGGSLINWSEAQVNWNQFGAGDPSLSDAQVWENFVQATGP